MRKIFANDHLAGRAVNKPLLLIGGAASAALLACGPIAAFASSTGSNTATVSVSVAVRSLTVTPASSTFGTCTDGSGDAATVLTIPGGTCQTGIPGSGVGGITITNTGVAGHIDINGAAAQPSDVTNCYSQVAGVTVVNPLCWSLGAAAGQDVYTEQTGLVPPGEMATYQTLTATPTCDQAIHAFGLMDPCSATTGFSLDAPPKPLRGSLPRRPGPGVTRPSWCR